MKRGLYDEFHIESYESLNVTFNETRVRGTRKMAEGREC